MTHRHGTHGIGAGAPANEIEVTSAMVDAGVRAYYELAPRNDSIYFFGNVDSWPPGATNIQSPPRLLNRSEILSDPPRQL
jgi:hypothetical protein